MINYTLINKMSILMNIQLSNHYKKNKKRTMGVKADSYLILLPQNYRIIGIYSLTTIFLPV